MTERSFNLKVLVPSFTTLHLTPVQLHFFPQCQTQGTTRWRGQHTDGKDLIFALKELMQSDDTSSETTIVPRVDVVMWES